MNNPFSFFGRIRRKEYNKSLFLYLGVVAIYNTILDANELSLVYGFFHVPLIMFIIAKGVKRCHDRGRNGFFQLIPFYPLVMIFGKSIEGKNKYDEVYLEEMNKKTEVKKNGKSLIQKINIFRIIANQLKSFNKGLVRLIISLSLFVPIITSIITYSLSRFSVALENTIIAFILSFTIFWTLFLVGIWIYKGFKEENAQ